MQLEPISASISVESDDRRLHDRVKGPFDASRVGLLQTPVQLYDLSCGGCFIVSFHDQSIGAEITLMIDLPHEGRITVRGRTLYRREGFGFAVEFTEMSGEAQSRLERAIARLQRPNRDLL